jgi:HNH endonuclease
MSKIEYRRIKNYPAYLIGSDGTVLSRHGRRAKLKPNIVRGYPRVELRNSGGKSTRRYALVHLLVLEAFVGPCPKGMEACHWDDNPINNELENLRWGTRRENREDCRRNGHVACGTRNAQAKLTEFAAWMIKILYREGLVGTKELAKDFGVTPSMVWLIGTGRKWAHLQ